MFEKLCKLLQLIIRLKTNESSNIPKYIIDMQNILCKY